MMDAYADFLERKRMVDPATGSIAEFVRSRAEELMQDHARLRIASGSASRVTVEAVLPPDVIGLFTLMPGEA